MVHVHGGETLPLIKDEQYTLFRNDAPSRDSQNTQPFGGTAVYSRLDYYPSYPYCFNRNAVEITILRFMIPHAIIVAVYRSISVSIRETCDAIKDTLNSLPTQFNISIGDL